MASKPKSTFEFNNHIAPRYIEPLLMQMAVDRWYSMSELHALLRQSGINVQDKKIVLNNSRAWSLVGIGETQMKKDGGVNLRLFKLSHFGQQLRNLYSTNKELFFDLIHYCFYTAWSSTKSTSRIRFWLYWRVCDELWQNAPSPMDSMRLTNRLQQESQASFPDLKPSFPERSVRGIFPWLVALTPPFLIKADNKGALRSNQRSHCSPHLFHLATDLVLREEQLSYGTAMTIGESQIEATCRMCLLDPERYWSMAELTELSIRGFGLKRSQWGRSIILSGPPSWIDLPNLTISDDVDVIGDTEEDA